MKLVVFGLTISSSWGNGHATLWRALCRALGERGHTVEFFERDAPYYAAHRDLTEFHGGRLHLYGRWADAAAAARTHLADADAAVVTSYCPDGVEATELVLSSPVAVRAFYDLDTPVTLDHFRSGAAVPYLGPRLLADFDLVLSYTGGAWRPSTATPTRRCTTASHRPRSSEPTCRTWARTRPTASRPSSRC